MPSGCHVTWMTTTFLSLSLSNLTSHDQFCSEPKSPLGVGVTLCKDYYTFPVLQQFVSEPRYQTQFRRFLSRLKRSLVFIALSSPPPAAQNSHVPGLHRDR